MSCAGTPICPKRGGCSAARRPCPSTMDCTRSRADRWNSRATQPGGDRVGNDKHAKLGYAEGRGGRKSKRAGAERARRRWLALDVLGNGHTEPASALGGDRPGPAGLADRLRNGGGGAARSGLQLHLLAARGRTRDRTTADLDFPARPRRLHDVCAAEPCADYAPVGERTPDRRLLSDGRAHSGAPGPVIGLCLPRARDGRRFLGPA